MRRLLAIALFLAASNADAVEFMIVGPTSATVTGGEEFTIDVIVRNQSLTEVLQLGASVHGYDGIATFESGQAVDGYLFQVCFAGAGCFNGLENLAGGALVEDSIGANGNRVQIALSGALSPIANDGSVDFGLDGITGTSQFRLTFTAEASGQILIDTAYEGDGVLLSDFSVELASGAVFTVDVLPPIAGAGIVRVGSGSILDLGSSTLDLGCVDLDVSGGLAVGTGTTLQVRDLAIAPSGTLQGDEGTLEVTGSWNDQGTFAAGTGSVSFVDGCGIGSSEVLGNTTFGNVSFTTILGKNVFFEAGSTQTITGALGMSGAPGALLVIRSTQSGSEAFLDILGASSVAAVDVEDNHVLGRRLLVDGSSLLGTNVSGWLFAGQMPVPLLGDGAVLLLVFTVASLGARRARRRSSMQAGLSSPIPRVTLTSKSCRDD